MGYHANRIHQKIILGKYFSQLKGSHTALTIIYLNKDLITVNVRNRNVQISDTTGLVRLPNRLDFERLKSEQFHSVGQPHRHLIRLVH